MRDIHLDWSALHSAFQMPMPEVRCFLSVSDGKVIKLPPGDPAMASMKEMSDFVAIETIPSRIQYQWVDEFTKSIDDESLRVRMEAAINGKGAFRRFKDILLTMPDERRRWFEFRDQKMRERIIEWVREKGLQPINDPPWVTNGTSVEPLARNNPHDIEAVRDFLIDWFDGRNEEALQPLELENLANQLGERFTIKPL